jgi:hypothetical protein
VINDLFGETYWGTKVKSVILTATFFMVILVFSSGSAQQIYTWTDANGVVHLSDQAPPQDVSVDEVLKYPEKTPQQQQAIEEKIEQQRQRLERLDRIDAAQRAALEARRAEEKARQAKAEAEAELRANQEYVRQLSNRRWKRRKFRKRIERIKIETEATMAEAAAAAQQAEEAARKASEAAAAAGKP